MPTLLVVEDDHQTLDEIVSALTDYGWTVESARTGRDGLMLAVAKQYDAIVLDRMLPGGLEGLGMLAAIRSAGVTTPVLILSALSAVDERVRGLRAGGDDYLTKPFDFIELTARLDALMRRRDAPASAEHAYQVGPLSLNLLTREVTCAGRPVALLPREYLLLEFLMRHADQTVSRTMLFEAVWGYRLDERTNVIDVHVSRLRKKLDPTGALSLIRTVRGSGYTLRATD
ncbi:DNA-binding response regulator [Burkholderia lata]|uniref:response regulator transcription factor n=1 Tax=Burkholderia cepacia complex TaxID=87882 RepID=UPI00075BD0F2|nr:MULTISPECIES: response regulator transcription factor [Burkholderia cepacia complex]KVR69285.1 two-component system response regulator [Burkholderia vietnamiensis]VWC53815.1 DNA-binding response regulator [Burkholderia lata]